MKRDTYYLCPPHCPAYCHREFSMSEYKANIMSVFGRDNYPRTDVLEISQVVCSVMSGCYQYPAIAKTVFVRLFVIRLYMVSFSYIYTQFGYSVIGDDYWSRTDSFNDLKSPICDRKTMELDKYLPQTEM